MRRLPRRIARRQNAAVFEALEPRVLLSGTPLTAYTFSSIASLGGKTSGTQPEGLVMDSAGDLFGVAFQGGAKGYGTVFEIVHNTSTIITLAAFNGTNGMGPRGNLLIQGGNIFGTTVGGGAFGKGTVFELTPAGTASTLTTLASFNGTNGSYPFAGLIADGSGNLFGTSMGAKLTGYASTVFELTPAGTASTLTTLATFKNTDQPTGTLAIDSSGNIFGTTFAGGTHSDGSIFEVFASSHAMTTLFSFNGTNGARPDGSLLLDSQGNLTGLTAEGGANSDGTLFKFFASSSTLTTLATFNGTNGQRPLGDLLVDGAGNIFGVTAIGGANSVGTVFERPAGTANTLTTLYSFKANSTGFNPTGFLVMDSNLDLLGATFSGGTSNYGTIFKLLNNTVFAQPPAPALAIAPTLQLVITQQPVSTASGKSFVLVVKLEDAQGHVVSSGAKLTLALASGLKGGIFGGTHTVSFVNGVARVSNLVLKGKGDYTISVVQGTLAATTGAITVM